MKEQDRFNKKLTKLENLQENGCSKFSSELKEMQTAISMLKRQEKVAPNENNPMNSSFADYEENDLSTMSEIVQNMNHPNENENYETSVHPSESQMEENLYWKTPAAMHRNLRDFLPAKSSVRQKQQLAPTSGYRLDYTGSPTLDTGSAALDTGSHAQNNTEIDIESPNQSFLGRGQQEHSNL